MGQIIINYICVFLVPFLTGTAVRFLCRHAKKAHLITLVFIALAVIGWGAYCAIPAHGSELYGIIALTVTSIAAGTLLTGFIMRLKRNR